MQRDFWLDKWASRDIAFHEKAGNQLLVKHFSKLHLPKGGRVLVPLCGKSLDLAWLSSQGLSVVGVELAETAVNEFFAAVNLTPKISQVGNLKCFQAESFTIFCGDVFELSSKALGKIDAVYDRAALVALPEEMRSKYTRHLKDVSNKAPQLVITFEYDQNTLAGPPFSIDEPELQHHYGEDFSVSLLESVEVPGGLKGKCFAKESVWILSEKSHR